MTPNSSALQWSLQCQSVAYKVLDSCKLITVRTAQCRCPCDPPQCKIKLADRQKFIKLNFPYFNSLARLGRTTEAPLEIAGDHMRLAANGRGRRILEKHLIWKNFMSKISVEIGQKEGLKNILLLKQIESFALWICTGNGQRKRTKPNKKN